MLTRNIALSLCFYAKFYPRSLHLFGIVLGLQAATEKIELFERFKSDL